MNTEKYDHIKKDYCIKVSRINLNALTNKPIQFIEGENLTYSTNNEIVSFIDENGIAYVTPYYEVINTLKQAGYKQSNLYVPFAENKCLNEGANGWKWKFLLANAKECKLKNIDISENFNIEESLNNNIGL